MKTFYKDKNLEIRLNENIDITDMVDTAFLCIDAGLTGLKSYAMLAKDPLYLWGKMKRDIVKEIKYIEDLLKK